ncbi:unnamed protein product, partial [Pylaiella littoralis]
MIAIVALPKDVLHTVLGFTKTDSYFMVGSVCKAFRDQFLPREKTTRTSKFTQSLALFDLAVALNVSFVSASLLDDLISRDEIEVIPRALSRAGVAWDHFCVERAAEVGSFRFFRWLTTTELVWLPENAHFSAASAGDLGMMRFLVEIGAGFPDQRSFHAAAERRDHAIVDWLHELELDRSYTMTRAARDDSVDAFAQSSGDDDGAEYITQACIHGSFDVLEYFRCSVGRGPTAKDCNMAAQLQRWDVVGWFSEFFP